jgi:hypothetical protein
MYLLTPVPPLALRSQSPELLLVKRQLHRAGMRGYARQPRAPYQLSQRALNGLPLGAHAQQHARFFEQSCIYINHHSRHVCVRKSGK